jgi:hypothetical protein
MAKKVRKKNLTIIGDPEFIEQIIEQRPGLLEHYDLEIEEPLPRWPPGVEKQPTKGETTRAIVAFARRKALLRLPFWQDYSWHHYSNSDSLRSPRSSGTNVHGVHVHHPMHIAGQPER